LSGAARRFGSKMALLVERRAFTFLELDALSSRAANGLVACGVQPGDRVTLYGPELLAFCR
jgi:non-ribosomal peptide synthetase component E (peptide arylation enzyme)